ncbi:MAG: hypothetical protein ABIF08_01865 [Nanoarchaeota archaeon]
MFRKKKSKYMRGPPGRMPPGPPRPDEFDINDIKEMSRPEDLEMEPIPDEESSVAPPLFIKIEKYNDIVNHIKRLKSLSLGLRDALDALGEIEKEIANGVVVANRALDGLNEIVRELDIRFAKVREMEDKRTPKHIDDYVQRSYERVEKLKDTFDEMER